MKKFYRYAVALALPFVMAACERQTPVTPDNPDDKKPETLEAKFEIKNASKTVEFELGETRSFEVEYANVASLSVEAPKGWEASVEDTELVVTAPGEDAEEYDEDGKVTVLYTGEDGEQKSASLSVKVAVSEEPVVPEEISFELICTEITSTSAHLKVIPNRDDIRYYYDVCTMEDYESVDGDVSVIISQYIDYLLAYNPSLTMEDMLEIMLSQGTDEDDVTGLPAGTEMCFYALAVDDAGEACSEPAVITFTTESAGDPSECTFEMTVSEIKGTTVFIEITPSDPSVRYWYAVTPRADYPGDIPLAVAVKDEAQAYANEVGMTLEQVIAGVTVAGPVAEYWYDLELGTGYYLYAFAMDKQGNAVGPMFKESFNTAEEDISDADIALAYRYFDGDALHASDPERFPNAAGRVVVQVKAEPNVYATDWAVAVGAGDMTNADAYPDDATINAILASGVAQYNKEISTFYATWNTCTIFGFAADYSGYNGVLHRILVEPTKEGVSPVEEYYDSTSVAAAMAFTMKPQNKAKVNIDNRMAAGKSGYRF